MITKISYRLGYWLSGVLWLYCAEKGTELLVTCSALADLCQSSLIVISSTVQFICTKFTAVSLCHENGARKIHIGCEAILMVACNMNFAPKFPQNGRPHPQMLQMLFWIILL